MRKQKQTKSEKGRRVYIRLLVSYLIVFMVPLVVSMFGLRDIARTTQKDISESIISTMHHTGRELDNDFTEIDSVIEKASGNDEIRYAATQIDDQEKYIQISHVLAVQKLMKATQVLTLVEDYYLYFYKNDMVIGPGDIYLDADSMNREFVYGDDSFDAWRNRLLNCKGATLYPAQMTYHNKQRQSTLIYMQPLFTSTGIKGTFFFPIAADSVKDMLSDAYIGQAGWAYVLDRSGQVLLTVPSEDGTEETVPEESLPESESTETILNGEKVLVFRCRADKTGLEFISVLPEKYISRQIYSAQMKLIWLMLVAVIVCLVAIFLIVRSRGRSVDQILQMLVSSESTEEQTVYPVSGNEMNYISSSLRKLIDSNSSLKENLIEKEAATRGLLLSSILLGRGEYSDDATLQSYGIHLKGSRVRVIAWQIELPENEEGGPGQLSLYKQILQTEINAINSGDNYLCDLSLRSGAFLCVKPDGAEKGEEELTADLGGIVERFHSRFGVRVRFAAGGICTEISEIGKSFDRLSEMLLYGPAMDRPVQIYGGNAEEQKYYYYPMAVEERLLNAVRTGNVDALHDQLHEIYNENVLNRNISPDAMHFLVNDLQGTIYRAMFSLSGKNGIDEKKVFAELEEVNQETDILIRLQKVNHIFQSMCETVSSHAGADTDSQKERIAQYIEENYRNSDLSLSSISDYFGYTGPYFSRLFKELFGENFASYLEKKRIGEVCRLLAAGNETLEGIARETGYNSVYVMRSAFKRLKAVTPNEYRKMHQEDASK